MSGPSRGRRVCRFRSTAQDPHVGVIAEDEQVIDLAPAGVSDLTQLFDARDPLDMLARIERDTLPRFALADVVLLAPVERHEVWAAGVTYLRSKTARMEESDFSATAYDTVYSAERPEIFFKSIADKVVAPGEPVGIRRDARWSVPEPELALVLNPAGTIVGFTIGNDMSSRDIEGENLLYLAQAKIYDRCCALGPCVLVGPAEDEVRGWPIRLAIRRDGREVFTGETSVGNIKRGFRSLAEYLFRSQRFPRGVVLLTGTGIVPPDTFTLEARDAIEIEIPAIGRLRNTVEVV